MTSAYRLQSGPAVSVTGPLALIAPQALDAATRGREALVTGPDATTVTVTSADPDTVTVRPYGPLQLFAATSSEPPAWATRLAGIINQLQKANQ